MNPEANNVLADLFISIASELQGHQSDIANSWAHSLLTSTKLPVNKAARMLPQCRELDHVDFHRGTKILRAIGHCREYLHWSESNNSVNLELMQAQLAFIELLGPAGMVKHEQCRVGLLLLCANNVYSAHRHAAEELYLVIHGSARWSSDRSAPRLQGPGAFIHHLSRESHAMTTYDEPLLAVWCWTGDIRFSTYEMI